MREIDGKTVPIQKCDWVMWRSCGCPQGVAVAGVYATWQVITEEDVWREFYSLKRDRDKAKRQGFRLELMTHERYCREVSPRMTVRCEHESSARAS